MSYNGNMKGYKDPKLTTKQMQSMVERMKNYSGPSPITNVIDVLMWPLGRSETEVKALSISHNVAVGVFPLRTPEDREFSYEKMSEIVGGNIELFPIKDENFDVVVNEDGIPLNLDVNLLASLAVKALVLGPVLFVRKGVFR
jgi:hypothetical protein